MSDFGFEIKRLRISVGLTQKQLAVKIGTSSPFVTQLETGIRSDCSTATLYALSDALGVPCDHWRPFLAAKPVEPKPKKRK